MLTPQQPEARLVQQRLEEKSVNITDPERNSPSPSPSPEARKRGGISVRNPNVSEEPFSTTAS